MKERINTRIGLALIMPIIVTGSMSCTENKEKKPDFNVLFIAVDDLRPELNCYGATQIKSPNIDRLASQGIRFTNAYVQQSISMATRASIMTGYRPERNGIYTGESVKDLMPGVITLNKLFAQNGYNVSAFGKIYHYGSDHQDQFGDAHMDPTENLPGRGYYTDEALEKMAYNEAHPVKGRSHKDRGPAFEWADVPDSAYIDGYNTEYALRKLKENKQKGEPFFMGVGFHKPHLPFNAPQKYWDIYPIESIQFPEIKDAPENATRYTLRGWGELRNYWGIPKTTQPVGEDTTLILRQGYYACVSYVDAQIGKLLDELKALDLDKNTIIVLWGDHGYKLGDYGYWAKWSNMDIDTRVPLIVSVPGGKKGVSSDAMVELVDLYPTLADLCGFEKPAHLEGKSFMPLLENPDIDWKTEVYTLWPHDRADYDKAILGYAVKTKRFNYVEWVNLSTGELLATELYDHMVDPKETKNVIDEPQYAEAISKLEVLCKERQTTTDHDHKARKLEANKVTAD
ncbi:MAG: sulfatase [Bacteroidales bacterium]|nr:sulfatase [Bacteroidales bacterium]